MPQLDHFISTRSGGHKTAFPTVNKLVTKLRRTEALDSRSITECMRSRWRPRTSAESMASELRLRNITRESQRKTTRVRPPPAARAAPGTPMT